MLPPFYTLKLRVLPTGTGIARKKFVITQIINADVPAFIPRPHCETDKSRQHSINLDTDGQSQLFTKGYSLQSLIYQQSYQLVLPSGVNIRQPLKSTREVTSVGMTGTT